MNFVKNILPLIGDPGNTFFSFDCLFDELRDDSNP